MRTSILSRSVIALATLAITSAALTVAPANAATPAGVTRGDVLATASAVRAETTDDPSDYSPATQRLLRKLALSTCHVDAEGGESVLAFLAVPVESGRHADGLMASAFIYTPGAGPHDDGAFRACSFGALATASAGSVLSGTATLTGSTTIASRLSGDVFMTPVMIDATAEDDQQEAPLPSFSATGESAQSTTTTTSTKTWTPKTAKQKKAAKKSYATKLKAAKKTYQKALKRACHDKGKKSKAKRAYDKKKASAKRSYKRAIAKTSTIIRNTRTTVTKTPFNVAASYDLS